MVIKFGGPKMNKTSIYLFLIILFIFGCDENHLDSDTGYFENSFCLDHRGYEHELGTYWQCENTCDICSCDENGDIIIVDDGPKIVTKNCEERKYTGHPLPHPPK